jgi:alcohol dehydrogenase
MQANPPSQFFCPTRIVMGTGAYRECDALLAQLGADRVFVVLDRALASSPLYADIEAMLQRREIRYATFMEIEPDPSDTTVARAHEACAALGAKAILALGGGSTIDVAKAVGILATNGGRIHDYEGIERYTKPRLPMIAIPSTAGTGSEVSGSCVITDTQRNLKMSIRHARLNPADYAILDPLALRTMPAHVAAHSGMDAFVHAFEAFISRNANPITDAVCIEAIRLIAANIRPFVANRGNLDAGLAMLCGSALAGTAFGITGLGNVHCMARFVGAFLHVSHGLSNALCLRQAARFNLIANPHKYARVAEAMGEDVRGLGTLAAADRAIAAIDRLCDDLGIPAHLAEVGAKPEQYEEMARLCVDANYNRWNPRDTQYADFLALFHASH